MKDPLADATPEVGYQTVEWDLLKPPDERVMPLTHTNRLKLSEMSVRPDGDLTEYSLVDRAGNTYTKSDFDRIPETPDPERLDEVLTAIESSTGKPHRLALAHLAEIAAEAPAACTAAVEPMVGLLGHSPPAVQGEALNVLTMVCESDPELTRSGVDPAVTLLDSATHPLLRSEAVQFLATFAAHDPTAVTSAVPDLAALLRDESTDADVVASILAAVVRAQPDALVDVVPKLELFLETEPERAHTRVLTVIGLLSKEQPEMTVEAVPTAGELLSAEEMPLRSNAAGVLADIAGEYPTKVKPWVPEAIELMDDSDEQVRHNATAILARVAAEHPDAVRPAEEQLLAVLDDDPANTRFNACWALNHINAKHAVDTLREIAAKDPDADVRSVAQLALDNLED
ncbi:HEAT repeat domain-containing protein [Halorubrum salinarum]|uniref:HEAT repeat domain-containing protein n=1 Tax=Halorubrum salinarum TaxID=2739057 RepID=A0A7D4BDR2_9EURY|nr:HEAT repeat domain-containing protein [Halorubrum salinarum]QKG93531.1 HEAT repeat domain-containing protein [Halorubrum salinarum]